MKRKKIIEELERLSDFEGGGGWGYGESEARQHDRRFQFLLHKDLEKQSAFNKFFTIANFFLAIVNLLFLYLNYINKP